MVSIKRILVPLDGSESADRALSEALRLAKIFDAELDFIYVANLNGAIGGYPLPANSGFSGSVLKSVAAAGQTILDRALDRTPDEIKAKGHCVSGVPAQVILHKAKELDADLIVMGSRGLGAIKGALLGSVSRFLLERAECPVMAVKAGSPP